MAITKLQSPSPPLTQKNKKKRQEKNTQSNPEESEPPPTATIVAISCMVSEAVFRQNPPCNVQQCW